MNTNPNDQELLWQLRNLRRETMPANDLWPGIAARIAQQDTPSGNAGNVVPLRRRGVRLAPFALAASLVLAVGVAWQQRPDFGVEQVKFWQKSYLGVPSPYAADMAAQCDAVINGVGH